MTGPQITTALHSVAESTEAPAVDRLTFQRQVRRERRRRYAGQAGVAVAVVAAVVAAGVTLAPFVRDQVTGGVAPAAPIAGSVDLETPVYLAVDGRLTAFDHVGRTYDVGARVEEVVGFTSEGVYAVDTDSRLVRFEADNGDEGPQGSWTFEEVESEVAGPVQGARLSADGRYLGWVDLDETVHVRDLKAGTTTDYGTRGSVRLVDVAQGSGFPLVIDDVGLQLLDGSDRPPFGSSTVGSATRDLVAVADGRSTLLYRLDAGAVRAFAEVPGEGLLSPYGDWVVSVATDPGDASSTVRLAAPGQEPRPLQVRGRPIQVGWADDQTVLVVSSLDGAPALFGCEASEAPETCVRLEVGAETAIELSR